MKKLIYVLLIILVPSIATAGSVNLLEEGVNQGFGYKANCVGAGIVCSRSGQTLEFNVSGVAGGSGQPIETQNDGVSLTTNTDLLNFGKGLTATKPSGDNTLIVLDQTDDYVMSGSWTFNSPLDISTDMTITGALTVGGDLGVSGSVTATNLSGTNTGDVTLAGSLDYITISNQVITRNAVVLTTDVSGTLPVANGGTGVTSSTGTTNVVLSNSPTLVTPALGTPSALVLTNATGLTTAGLDSPTGSDTNVVTGTAGSSGICAEWNADGDLVEAVSAAACGSGGGGASPLTVKGDVFTFSTLDTALPVGTNGQILIVDSAETTGLRWGADQSGAGSAALFSWTPHISSIKLNLDSAHTPQIEGGRERWSILYDSDTLETGSYMTTIDTYSGGGFTIGLDYNMLSSTSGDVTFEVRFDCISEDTTVDTPSFGTVNTLTETVPGTLGNLSTINITSANEDSCALNDLLIIDVSNDNYGATGDAMFRGIRIREK